MVLAFRRRGSVIPICLYLLVGRSMKGRTAELVNESFLSEAELNRIFTTSLLPLMIISQVVHATLLPNIYSFRHIHAGIQEIMADYVHQGMTRNLIFIFLESFFLIVIKDVLLFPFRCAHKWNNLMENKCGRRGAFSSCRYSARGIIENLECLTVSPTFLRKVSGI
uniref:Succinate dehydrogenase cytochrome subunit 4 n=1 Tax=Sciadopitys verticillata TaxID=28979 RepID=A0A8H2SEQ6_SCIVE|nr:succinate dehydrogenase cytochrome subunit 4 [Sciadopitys verticillata]BDC46294.1 succinate dehydrogenase cytochrome subunit 4 [Sciadopitys verticillata]